MADHVADHEVGVDLVTFNDCFGRCDEFIVECFESFLIINFKFRNCTALCSCEVRFIADAETVQTTHRRLHDGYIDLVECQPVFDLVLISLKAGSRVFDEQVNDAPV